MAYTIISQNNTTTTLADENGNVITVPARVTLATSTDYTITKVNNNSVDLEDGDGKIIRGVPACVVLAGGGGGGDQHNLGYYATQAALEEAYPTAEAGDWAIVGATDTVWIWDEDTSAWIDSDQKGQVTSVNGQTGAVTVSEVPSQTGQSGKFLTTDGTDASWSDKPLVNKATGAASLSVLGSVATASSATNVGSNTAAGNSSTVVGTDINAATSVSSVVVGHDVGQGVGTPNGSILLGTSIKIRNGLKVVALGTSIDTGNNNSSNLENIDENGIYWGAGWDGVLNKYAVYKLLSANGTVPTARLTKVNTTATLAVADWSSSTQTVTVSGVKADSVVFVSPAPASANDYASAGILCTAQAADSLTFTCTTTPTNAITVNVVCM